ncbi:MAG: molybdenum cofactor guanylyltransferase [Methylococcales bacterium]|nr:molybdenum cofactor guanylyltransferase [Methylococcales bacterium]
MNYPIDNISGVILAGGQARRMNHQNKSLLKINNKSMIEHVIVAIQPQVGKLYLNINTDFNSFHQMNLSIITDDQSEKLGPLAGINAVLSRIDTDYLVTVPCDSPMITSDLVNRLFKSMKDNRPCIAHDGLRAQPLFSLISKQSLHSLSEYIASGQRKAITWFKNNQVKYVDFSDKQDSFINANTPDDLQKLEAMYVAT